MPCSRARPTSSTSPASATSCLRSSGRLEYMSVNVQGTVHVLEAAAAAGSLRKLVYAASSSCYGLAETPTREDHPIRPQYPYALSKYQGEQAVFHWHNVYKLPVNSIRIFNAYGTRSRTSGAYGAVFGVFLRQKLAGKPFTVVGDGTQRRDFVYVTDVATAFLAAAESPIVGTRLERRRRQSADRQSPGRAARRRHGRTSPSGRASPTAPGPTSPASRRTSAGARGCPSRTACRASSPISTTGARRRCGIPIRSPRRPRPGSRCCLLSAEGRAAVIDAKYKAKIKSLEELIAAIGPRPRKRKVIMCHGTFDVVHPGHIRHLMYANDQGRHPGRQPHRRRAHQEGQLPPVRAAAAARPQSRRARHGRLRDHRPQRQAAREPRQGAARLLRQGLRVRLRRHAARDPGGEGGARRLRRRVHLHARRHRLLLLQADRGLAAEPRAREAGLAARSRAAHLRPPAPRARRLCQHRRARRRRHHRRFLHPDGNDRRPDQDADHVGALRGPGGFRRRRRRRRQAPEGGRRQRRRSPPCSATTSGRSSCSQDLQKAGVETEAIADPTRPTTNKNAIVCGGYRLLEGRHARQPHHLRPHPGAARQPDRLDQGPVRDVLRLPPRHLQPRDHPAVRRRHARQGASGSPTARWRAAGATSASSRAST